jgi:hypothetical protein
MEFSTLAKLRKSQINMLEIKQAFVNHYYLSVISGTPEFPPDPSDSLMTEDWGNNAMLYNGRPVKFIFSTERIPYNPKGNPYFYHILGIPGDSTPGFILKDDDFNLVLKYRL